MKFRVPRRRRSPALQTGAVYTNETEAVEWIVPRLVMTQLVIAAEGL